jgi:negative regulator of flagellin synthesis FlgM
MDVDICKSNHRGKVMKINDALNSNAGLPSTAPAATRTDKAADNSNKVNTPASIKVQISPLSTQLQALQSTQAGSAVFETKKVEEIKLAISEGRFQVNAEKVADGLLETVKDLLNSRRQF